MAFEKIEYLTGDVLTADQMNKIQDAILTDEGNIEAHIGNKSNPHNVTATQVGAIPENQKGVASGVATLGSDGKIPTGQLPSMDYIPTNQKGVANGVATLGADKKVPAEQLPEISSVKSATVTLTTNGWTLGSDERYYQNVSVANVTADTKVVMVDVDLSTDDADAKIAYLEAWALPSANEVDQGNGKLTFYAWDKPTVNIPVNVGVM